MQHGEHEVYSYQTYVKNNNILTRRKNPLIVLDKHGFDPVVGHWDLDKGDKAVETAKVYADSRQKPSVIVFYRKNDMWGCPILELFVKVKEDHGSSKT